MGLTVILFLAFFLLVVALAHHAGKEMGREQEFVRNADRQSLCPECRMLRYTTTQDTRQRST